MQGLDRFGRFIHRRELVALQRRLDPGETVVAVVAATLERRGVLAITSKRMLFVHRTVFGSKSVGWPHRQVIGLTRKPRVDDAQVVLRTIGGAAVTFSGVPKSEAEAFEDAAATRPRGPDELVDFTPPQAVVDRKRRLERLDRMLQRGSITRTEYEHAKRGIASEAAND